MKHFYTLLLIVLPWAVFAQSNYLEGLVIKNNGDTLKGFIDYREWEQNPRSINFKANKDGREILNFTPQTAKEFQVTSAERYIAYTGMISMDKNRFPDLPLALDSSKKNDAIFLKQVARGKYLTLFYHQDDVKTRFFVAETNMQPVELKYSQYYDSESQLMVKAAYRGQLIFYINKYVPDDRKLVLEANEAGFNQADIEKIVSGINGEVNSAKKAVYFRFFVGGGLSNIESHFQDDNESIAIYKMVGPVKEGDVVPERVSRFSTTASPLISFGADLFANPTLQKLIFRAELSFSHNSPKFQYLIADAKVDNNVTQYYSFDQYSATLTPQVILNLYNKNNFKIYIDGGAGLNFSTYSNTMLSKGTKSDLEPFWISFPVQAGMIINKKIEISFTYAAPTSLVNYFNYFGVNSQNVSVGIKYLFGTH